MWQQNCISFLNTIPIFKNIDGCQEKGTFLAFFIFKLNTFSKSINRGDDMLQSLLIILRKSVSKVYKEQRGILELFILISGAS